MEIHNYDIKGFQDFILNYLSLKGKKSRMRMRFLNLLNNQWEQVGKEQNVLLKEQNALDDEGNIHFVEGTQYPDVDNRQEYEKDFQELLNETFHVDESEQNKDMLLILKDAILDYDEELIGQPAATHDQLCTLFENLVYKDESDEETEE